MKRKAIEFELDHPVPEFAKNRVSDFLLVWNPNFHSFVDLARSLYCQGVADGFECGERFRDAGSHIFTDDRNAEEPK